MLHLFINKEKKTTKPKEPKETMGSLKPTKKTYDKKTIVPIKQKRKTNRKRIDSLYQVHCLCSEHTIARTRCGHDQDSIIYENKDNEFIGLECIRTSSIEINGLYQAILSIVTRHLQGVRSRINYEILEYAKLFIPKHNENTLKDIDTVKEAVQIIQGRTRVPRNIIELCETSFGVSCHKVDANGTIKTINGETSGIAINVFFCDNHTDTIDDRIVNNTKKLKHNLETVKKNENEFVTERWLITPEYNDSHPLSTSFAWFCALVEVIQPSLIDFTNLDLESLDRIQITRLEKHMVNVETIIFPLTNTMLRSSNSTALDLLDQVCDYKNCPFLSYVRFTGDPKCCDIRESEQLCNILKKTNDRVLYFVFENITDLTSDFNVVNSVNNYVVFID